MPKKQRKETQLSHVQDPHQTDLQEDLRGPPDQVQPPIRRRQGEAEPDAYGGEGKDDNVELPILFEQDLSMGGGATLEDKGGGATLEDEDYAVEGYFSRL